MTTAEAYGDLERHPAVELLIALARHRSITPADAGCQSLIADRLERAGFRCEEMPFGDVSNLWARLGDSTPVLCFAGHTDVVPPGDLSAWRYDPFEPTRDGDWLYGRGVADMKAALAAMVIAGERFAEHPGNWKGSLAYLITSDEEGPAVEGTARVIEELAERNEMIDWCLVGEPSSHHRLGDTLRIGRRGSLNGTITIRGTQGHVAYPENIRNPIAVFAPALAALHDVDWGDGGESFPPTSLQVVALESDAGADNVTPGTLKARLNFRFSDEWTDDALGAKVSTLLDSYSLDYSLEWQLSGRPFLTKRGPFSKAVEEAVRIETGQKPAFSTGGGTSDGRFIAPMGADVVEFGVVNASIHQVDERVSLADVPRLTDIYERIMRSMLCAE